MFITETPRLHLREITVDDAKNAYELNLDPEVIKYTGDGPFSSIEDARDFLSKYDHYKKYGFGRWAVINKTDNDFLGWCGLKYTEEKNEFDVGFRFFKKHWNKGYATESAKACIDLGFNKFNMDRIVGRAMKENTASINVLKKIGLTFWKNDTCGGEDGVIYLIGKKDGN
jgi:ribosomal-protein-alanine N-acetyltransferase